MLHCQPVHEAGGTSPACSGSPASRPTSRAPRDRAPPANEYATYYGFDTRRADERLIVMGVLSLASAAEASGKQAVMATFVRLARDLARNKTWAELERNAFAAVMRSVAKELGERLTKAKLAQVVPVAGAAFGGAFNAWYVDEVCVAASMLYRERFLARRYGVEIL